MRDGLFLCNRKSRRERYAVRDDDERGRFRIQKGVAANFVMSAVLYLALNVPSVQPRKNACKPACMRSGAATERVRGDAFVYKKRRRELCEVRGDAWLGN